MPISFLFSIYIMFISLCAFSAISLMALRHFSSLCPISYHFMFVFVFYFCFHITLCARVSEFNLESCYRICLEVEYCVLC